MIKDNQRILNGVHVFLDAVIIILSYIIAWYCKFEWGSADGVQSISQQDYFGFLRFIVPLLLLLYYWCGMYLSKRYSSSEADVINVLKANLIGIGIVIAGLYIWKIIDFSRAMFGIFYAITCGADIFNSPYNLHAFVGCTLWNVVIQYTIYLKAPLWILHNSIDILLTSSRITNKKYMLDIKAFTSNFTKKCTK